MSEIPAGSTLTVTIGRNIGSEPMEESMWERFTSSVIDTLTDLVSPDFTFTYNGQGEWDGVTEDSRAIVAVNTHICAEVRDRLHDIALEFQQAAIGLSVGLSELV